MILLIGFCGPKLKKCSQPVNYLQNRFFFYYVPQQKIYTVIVFFLICSFFAAFNTVRNFMQMCSNYIRTYCSRAFFHCSRPSWIQLQRTRLYKDRVNLYSLLSKIYEQLLSMILHFDLLFANSICRTQKIFRVRCIWVLYQRNDYRFWAGRKKNYFSYNYLTFSKDHTLVRTN